MEAEDWDTGAQVTLPLDPLKTPIEAAEALYKQARKQRRAVEQVAPLIEGECLAGVCGAAGVAV